MDTRDFVATYVMPAVGMLLTAVIGYVAMLIRTHTKSAELAAATTAVAQAAEAAVANVEHDTVAALKDPTKPGAWTDVTKQAAKDAAIAEVRAAVPQAVASLKAHSGDVEKLIGGLIERAVAGRRASVAPPAAASVPPPAAQP